MVIEITGRTRLSAGIQTVLPTVRFSPATCVEFTAAANSRMLRVDRSRDLREVPRAEVIDGVRVLRRRA